MADTPQIPRLPAPAGLGATGRRVWKSVAKSYALRPDEVVVLELAAKTADTVAELEAALVGQPLTTRGSMGQDREHPLLSECRAQRAALARLLAQLKLPDLDGAAHPNQHRAAAQSRWAMSHGPWANGGGAG